MHYMKFHYLARQLESPDITRSHKITYHTEIHLVRLQVMGLCLYYQLTEPICAVDEELLAAMGVV